MTKENSTNVQSQAALTAKLLALYDSNKNYIDEAEKFLTIAQPKLADTYKDKLTREDIDRMYSHISVLENVAKLLQEEFLMNKNGGLLEGSEKASDHRNT